MIIEPEHLEALYLENEQIIADAEAAGSRSTAAAYSAQQLVVRRFWQLPAASLEDAPYSGDAPNEQILIRGFEFDNCAAPGCENMPPCPQHQHQAWQAAVNRKWGQQ